MGNEGELTRHISTRRLFESVSPDFKEELQFEDWELMHLPGCAECQHIRDVFARQFIELSRPASTGNVA